MTTTDPLLRAPLDVRSRYHLTKRPLGLVVGGAAAMTLLHFYDPHRSGSYGYCPFLWLTGKPCPFCGGLRAMNDVTHGHVSAALTSNAAAVVILILGTGLLGRWTARRWRGDASAEIFPKSRTFAVICIAALAVFTVYRWTPWGAWLYNN
ncbi:DUF2752 domain-containing protein [Rudaeicoccus suwonensis]|uniref:Uncharacterized protein DUF2752 n=1 Tax=Rudaeicoccus suwonensis TaxID=657409 RepID=A0A561EC28_9MICO|nr:DUF2752 domain-containing protein [Rudaeicoccus suwonensis]TWE13159.1 uncharacterized protein DUF2752 [Rudaeicoccus suwonensis]